MTPPVIPRPLTWKAFTLIVIGALVFGVLVPYIAASVLHRPVDQQLQRVTLDGQECVVVERRQGRIEGVDCNWNGR